MIQIVKHNLRATVTLIGTNESSTRRSCGFRKSCGYSRLIGHNARKIDSRRIFLGFLPISQACKKRISPVKISATPDARVRNTGNARMYTCARVLTHLALHARKYPRYGRNNDRDVTPDKCCARRRTHTRFFPPRSRRLWRQVGSDVTRSAMLFFVPRQVGLPGAKRRLTNGGDSISRSRMPVTTSSKHR